jgi:photosystem II stability/assembly factor-like uncharacterized protein
LRSNDDGDTWHRLGLEEAIEFDGTVRSMAVAPDDPWRVYAGADSGFCISEDGGAHFRRAEGSIVGMTVWSIAVDPVDPKIVYAGTGAPSRAALFKSEDRGESWRRLPPEIPEFCAGVNRPRLLALCVDPDDHDDVWFGVEEGGAWRSPDAGETWTRIDGERDGVRSSDIHAISILPAGPSDPKTIFVLSVNTAYRSTDDGATWTGRPSRERFDGLYYTRTVFPLGQTNGVLLAVGDGTPGRTTRIYRSRDRGDTWKESRLDAAPNSTVWAFGAHTSEPALVFAGTKYGDLFRSMDAGATWKKEWRSFSEITAVAWTPVKAPLVAHAQSTRS